MILPVAGDSPISPNNTTISLKSILPLLLKSNALTGSFSAIHCIWLNMTYNIVEVHSCIAVEVFVETIAIRISWDINIARKGDLRDEMQVRSIGTGNITFSVERHDRYIPVPEDPQQYHS